MSESEHVERKELLLKRLPKTGFTVNDPASETLQGDASDGSESIEAARFSELRLLLLQLAPATASSGGEMTASTARPVLDSVARSDTAGRSGLRFDRFSFEPKGVEPKGGGIK